MFQFGTSVVSIGGTDYDFSPPCKSAFCLTVAGDANILAYAAKKKPDGAPCPAGKAAITRQKNPENYRRVIDSFPVFSENSGY